MPKNKIKMVLRNLIKATKAPLQLVCVLKKNVFSFLFFFKYVISGYQDLPFRQNNLIDSHTRKKIFLKNWKKKKKYPF